ncbi:MAG: CPBP family intramembrane metalloprotease [Oscillospiraceae bacterium]
MNGYNFGFNPFDSNAHAEFEQHRQLERSGLKKNASRLGILLVIYVVLSNYIMPYLFMAIYHIAYAHSFSGRYSVVRDYFAENYSSFLGMLLNICCVVPSLLVVLLVVKPALRIELSGLFHYEKGSMKIALIAFPAAFLGNIAAGQLTNIFSNIMQESGVTVPEANFAIDTPELRTFLIQIFYVVILGPVVEEVLYRGIALRLLKPYGKGMAVVVSSAVFALMHGNIPQAVNAFLFGLLMGTIAVQFNSILPTILIHILNNAFSSVTDVADALNSQLLYNIYGIVFLLVMLLGGLVVFVYYKKIRLPKNETRFLSTGEKYVLAFFNFFMLAYWAILAYEYVRMFLIYNQ